MKNIFRSKSARSESNGTQSNAPKAASPMTNERLDALIRQASKTVKGEAGYWQFNIGGRDVLVITDARHNRMRIMSPVTNQEGLDKAELIRLLEANFASALDSKYALRDQTLWSVFTHPLAELSDEQFLDCLAQVANLADNFGHSYASSNLFFGGG